MPASRTKSVMAATEILNNLGDQDLLYAHHGNVYARPEAYKVLGDFMEKYADEREKHRIERLREVVRVLVSYLDDKTSESSLKSAVAVVVANGDLTDQ